MTYAPVDLWTPWILYWVAAVAIVAGASLVAAGAWRARRHRRRAEASGTHQDRSVMQDTRTQRRVGVGALVLAGALVAVGVWLHLEGLAAFRENLAAKYGYTAVERIRQSGGPGFIADLTRPDGTVLRDERVILEPTGEPMVGEDIFLDVIGGS